MGQCDRIVRAALSRRVHADWDILLPVLPNGEYRVTFYRCSNNVRLLSAGSAGLIFAAFEVDVLQDISAVLRRRFMDFRERIA